MIGLVFALGGLKSLITGQLSVFERGKLRLLHHFAGWQARVLAVVLILFGLVGLPSYRRADMVVAVSSRL